MSVDSPTHKSNLPITLNLRNCGLFAAGALVLVAAFFIVASSAMALGNPNLPGPGFFPLALGIALLLLSSAVGLKVWQDAARHDTIELGHRDVLITVVLLLLVPYPFERAGAYLTLGVFCFLMLVLIAHTRILTAFASSAVAMGASWYFFHKLLGVQLPLGVLAG